MGPLNSMAAYGIFLGRFRSFFLKVKGYTAARRYDKRPEKSLPLLPIQPGFHSPTTQSSSKFDGTQLCSPLIYKIPVDCIAYRKINGSAVEN